MDQILALVRIILQKAMHVIALSFCSSRLSCSFSLFAMQTFADIQYGFMMSKSKAQPEGCRSKTFVSVKKVSRISSNVLNNGKHSRSICRSFELSKSKGQMLHILKDAQLPACLWLSNIRACESPDLHQCIYLHHKLFYSNLSV